MKPPRNPVAPHPERLLAFLLAAYALVAAWDLSLRPYGLDYYQFWVVGRAAVAHETREPYSRAERVRLGEEAWQQALAAERALANGTHEASPGAARPQSKRIQAAHARRTLETYSTPWLYTVLGFLSLEDYDASFRAFQVASLLAYVAAILLLARLLGHSAAASALWVALLLLPFHPFADDTIAGNVNRLQLLLLAIFLLLELRARFAYHSLAAGVLLGLLIAFKPNLAGALLLFAVARALCGERRRLLHTCAGAAIGSSAAVLLSGACFGSLEPWRDWLGALGQLSSPGSPVAGSADEGNYSLARLCYERAGIAPGIWIALVLLGAAITALLLARRRAAGSARPDELASPELLVVPLGLGAAISLLASELAWQHYFVSIVPLAIALLRPRREATSAVLLLRLTALFGLAAVALQNVRVLFGLRAPHTAVLVVAGGTLLLFAAGALDLASRRADAASTG